MAKSTRHPASLGDRSEARLPIVQRRSRERQDRILAEAERIIVEVGTDGLKMSAVAAGCGISIGSLYQYFRDKGAILSAIAERCHEATRDCIDAGLGPADDWPALSAAFGTLIDDYHAIFASDPVVRDVWSGIAADKALQAMELRAARENGARLAAHVLRVAPHADPGEVGEASFLVMALGESVMRLAVLCPPQEAARHVSRYAEMAQAELARAAGVAFEVPGATRRPGLRLHGA